MSHEVNEEDLEDLAADVERVINVEQPFRITPGEQRGRVKRSHEALVKKIGKPPTLMAVQRMRQAIKSGDTVLVVTGWMIPFWLEKGEHDGNLGAATLARAIVKGLDSNVVLISEESIAPVLKSACTGAGLIAREPQDMEKMKTYRAVASLGFPTETDLAKKKAKEILDNLEPSAIISLEHAGRSDDGHWYTGRGSDFSSSTAKIDYLFEQARDRGILTVGIGDLGNEIGMGNIREELQTILPAELRHIVTVVEADAPIFAGSSNWGAYALESVLAGSLGKQNILHDSRTHFDVERAAISAGSVDGIFLTPTFTWHGWNLEEHLSILELLRAIVRTRMERIDMYTVMSERG